MFTKKLPPFPVFYINAGVREHNTDYQRGKLQKKAYFIKVVFLKKWSKQSSPGPGKEMEQRENSQKFEVQAKLGNKKTCPPCP